jgi:A nuclease family of the HNH/ENDO VII superfamily with conserved AHH
LWLTGLTAVAYKAQETVSGLADRRGGDVARVPVQALKAAAKKSQVTRAAASVMRVARAPSSKRLGRNMENAGRFGTRNAKGNLTDDAAHLVAKGAKNADATASRRILKKFGIDLDDATNGSWLPHGRDTSKYPNPLGKSPHQATHRKAFHKELHKLLKNCRTKQEAEDVLDYVRGQLDKGIWP